MREKKRLENVFCVCFFISIADAETLLLSTSNEAIVTHKRMDYDIETQLRRRRKNSDAP